MFIYLGIGILIVGFVIFIAMRPATFTVTRTAVLPAGSNKVFALVNDFHEWDHWSPWAKLDPQCKNSFEGSVTGVGAKFAWDGNSEVGAGRMEIIESHPNDLIKIDLVFMRPMKATNLTVFTFRPEGHGTRVTWTMSGKNGFVGKFFMLLMNCDKMVGGQFEKGLNNMEQILVTRSST